MIVDIINVGIALENDDVGPITGIVDIINVGGTSPRSSTKGITLENDDAGSIFNDC